MNEVDPKINLDNDLGPDDVGARGVSPESHGVEELAAGNGEGQFPPPIESDSDDAERFRDDPELEAIEALQGTDFNGRYRIIDELARGGMGIVFRAEHLSLSRPVVIKVLKAGQVGSQTAKARFEREARRACQLDHPNVVTVHDFGYHEDLGYLVMEYVDGLTIYDYLKKYGPLLFSQFAPIAAAVLSGLGEAHRQDIIHRDIKASNIMLTFSGDRLHRVKILDFGLAKVEGAEEDEVTKASNLVGTMSTMPPERILCKPTDCRVDLYAFGVCAYRMIAGRRPFVGDDMNVLYQHVHEHPRPLTELLPDNSEYPLMVLEWVHRLLAKDPDDRPRDANEARNWLLETVSDTSVFRIDEARAPWLAQRSDVHEIQESFESTQPSWSVSSGPTSSYRTLTGTRDDSSLEATVGEPATESALPTQGFSPSLKWGVGLGVVGALTLGALGIASLSDLGDESSSREVVTNEAREDTKAVPERIETVSDLERMFEHIESELDRGAYGTAENLLNSVRSKLGMKPEYQVKAAEFQTRINIDKKLRRAQKAERNLRIESAMKLYDEVLSLDAGNSIAVERHGELSTQVVLRITSEPDGTVYVDSERVGKTPLEKLVPASFSKIEVRAKGYENYSASLIPDGGSMITLAVKMEPVKSGSRPPTTSTSTKKKPEPEPKKDPKDSLDDETWLEMK